MNLTMKSNKQINNDGKTWKRKEKQFVICTNIWHKIEIFERKALVMLRSFFTLIEVTVQMQYDTITKVVNIINYNAA
jgi:ribosomal protein L36